MSFIQLIGQIYESILNKAGNRTLGAAMMVPKHILVITCCYPSPTVILSKLMTSVNRVGINTSCAIRVGMMHFLITKVSNNKHSLFWIKMEVMFIQLTCGRFCDFQSKLEIELWGQPSCNDGARRESCSILLVSITVILPKPII